LNYQDFFRGFLRLRIYSNHLIGQLGNSQFKKYLARSGECADAKDVESFLRKYAVARWIEEEDRKKRGALEDYTKSLLIPKYGYSDKI
jgi:hypothetical protein